MPRRLAVRLASILAVAAALVWASAPASAASLTVATHDGLVLTATLDGRPIPPAEASRYFCHTRDYPIVRCFASQADVDADAGLTAVSAPPGTGTSARAFRAATPADARSRPYTVAYLDTDFGGTSLTIFADLPDLGPLGWNDAISSIRSIACGSPRYFEDVDAGGFYWTNACNESSASLGVENDRFSSVTNAERR